MHTESYFGINSFLTGASRLLLAEGSRREVRGSVCFELPEPFMFKITDPFARTVTIKERRWNQTLPYAESLWIASGRNDLGFICHYLDRLRDFSDDGVYMRGGYGPRLRFYNGRSEDYSVDENGNQQGPYVDQLRYVIECFEADRATRRAIVSLGDPCKDDFVDKGSLKITKDVPCTRELHFMKQGDTDKLDLIVKMRSNDLIWGASGVNIFNYTFMQEYVAAILKMEVGDYYHIVDNLHYYEYHQEMVKTLAQIDSVEESNLNLAKTFTSLSEFDVLVARLLEEEAKMRKQKRDYSMIHFEDEFFQHWYSKLYNYNLKKYAVETV